MKVFILTEGGKNIGFGHITRCTALYQAFEERGIIPKFIVNGDDSVFDLLADKNYEIFDWIDEKERLLELIQNVDIAIIDSYLADISIYQTISEIVKVPVYIDDNKRLDYPKGVVVNGAIYAEELNYPVKKGVTYLLGSKYMPLRKEFWDVPEKEIKENIESVMITFGGDDMRNMTPKVLRLLQNNFPDLIKNVVIGKGFKNICEVEELKDNKTNLIYYPDAEKIKNVMLESDIAISAAGQTLYELAVTRTPTIAISVAKNQLNNVKGWAKDGFIEYAGSCIERDILNNIYNCLEKIASFQIRKEKSKKEILYINGEGGSRIVESILKG
ncbi:MAG TPA: UDP-2,4-diacetamido-2,4,6-trideoxy-beta-L-altropyranose hydrolase [Ignavibacteriaceae bacterium]|nr:UDP-2,4-diacetamido-2,4,6-trideoxy-beta-L-altropyranose hydrolase [Ignavibacteriaceae bacterium]